MTNLPCHCACIAAVQPPGRCRLNIVRFPSVRATAVLITVLSTLLDLEVMHEPGDAVHPIDPVDDDAGVDRKQRPRRLPLFAAGFAAVALFGVMMTLIRPADDPPPSPAPGTTTAATDIPIAIPEATEPRPASPGLASSPDWVAVGTGRFQPGVTSWVPVWTGAEIVFQRTSRELVAFDPATETWRELAPAPIHIAGDDVTALWAGDELVVWTDEGAGAWDPVTDEWRVFGRWLLEPSSSRRIVWTGAEIIDLDSAIAVDPATGATRPITPVAASHHERAVAVWAADRVVVVPSAVTYDPATDTWADAPPSGLTPLAADAVWTGDHVFAADNLTQARGFDPLTGTWSSYPDVPLRFTECAPSTHMLRGRASSTTVRAWRCGTRPRAVGCRSPCPACSPVTRWSNPRRGVRGDRLRRLPPRRPGARVRPAPVRRRRQPPRRARWLVGGAGRLGRHL